MNQNLLLVIFKPPAAFMLPGDGTGYFPWHILSFRLAQNGLLAKVLENARCVPGKVDRDKLVLFFRVTDLTKALPFIKDELTHLGLLHMAEIGHEDEDGTLRLYYPLGTQPLSRHFIKAENWPPLMHPGLRELAFFPLGIFTGTALCFIHWGVGLAALTITLAIFARIGMRWQKVRRSLRK